MKVEKLDENTVVIDGRTYVAELLKTWPQKGDDVAILAPDGKIIHRTYDDDIIDRDYLAAGNLVRPEHVEAIARKRKAEGEIRQAAERLGLDIRWREGSVNSFPRLDGDGEILRAAAGYQPYSVAFAVRTQDDFDRMLAECADAVRIVCRDGEIG